MLIVHLGAKICETSSYPCSCRLLHCTYVCGRGVVVSSCQPYASSCSLLVVWLTFKSLCLPPSFPSPVLFSPLLSSPLFSSHSPPLFMRAGLLELCNPAGRERASESTEREEENSRLVLVPPCSRRVKKEKRTRAACGVVPEHFVGGGRELGERARGA